MAKVFISFMVAGFFSVFSYSQEQQTAVNLVRKAAVYVNTNGKEKSILEINRSDSRFCKGEMYVYVYDTNGVMIAHPKNINMVGLNLADIPDADGKFFRKDIIKLAKIKGKGWIDYKYKNPGNGEIKDKSTYVCYTDKMILCCSIYK